MNEGPSHRGNLGKTALGLHAYKIDFYPPCEEATLLVCRVDTFGVAEAIVVWLRAVAKRRCPLKTMRCRLRLQMLRLMQLS